MSFLISDGHDNDTDHFSFNQHVLQTIITIINATIETGTPLQRWLSSKVVMIEKVSNTPYKQIRVINIYEVD